VVEQFIYPKLDLNFSPPEDFLAHPAGGVDTLHLVASYTLYRTWQFPSFPYSKAANMSGTFAVVRTC
jgi:hypothetical protein